MSNTGRSLVGRCDRERPGLTRQGQSPQWAVPLGYRRQGLLQEGDRGLAGEAWPPVGLREPDGRVGQVLAGAPCSRSVRRLLERDHGPGKLTRLELGLAEPQEELTALMLVYRLPKLLSLEGHLVVACGLLVGELGHRRLRGLGAVVHGLVRVTRLGRLRVVVGQLAQVRCWVRGVERL